jgi:ribosomal-protein-alanine N-acetyltransferase
MLIDTDRLYSHPFSLPRKAGQSVDILLRVKDSPTVPVAGRVNLVYGNKRNRTYYISWYAGVGGAGQGFMSEGLACLLPQLFSSGVHRLVASIRPGNERSKNLASRLGFRYEGTAVSSLLLEGSFVDVEYWAKTENDK